MRTSRTIRRRTLTVVLATSVAAVPVLMLVALPAVPGCGSGDALGLEDWQRDLLFGFGSLAIGLLNSGAAGPAGQPGLACWDLNGNGVGDPAEDINGDGIFDALDCQGAPGAPAPVPDETGRTVPGEPGAPGLSCWDLNGDGVGDADEDVNGDGAFNALDCQGAEGPAGPQGNGGSGPQGPQGPKGDPGTQCWDLDGNSECDLASEDRNCDGDCDAEDCQVDSLFSVFIDRFYTIDDGSMGALPLPELQIVEIVEPALGASCSESDVEVTAYKVAMPRGYTNNNPVTMRLFFWRTGDYDPDGCFIFRIDSFMTRHSKGIYDMSPGGRFVRPILPAVVLADGMLVMIDLPLDNDDGSNGLMLDPLDGALLEADLLAFELNRLPAHDDGGCYTLLVAEFFESFPCEGAVSTQNAAVFLTEAEAVESCGWCTEDKDCDDDLFCTKDTCENHACVYTEDVVCDDGEYCTTDSCDEDNDECVNEPWGQGDADGDCVIDCYDQCPDTPPDHVVDLRPEYLYYGCSCVQVGDCEPCGAAQADIVLMLDRTGSLSPEELAAEADAANDLLATLNASGVPHGVAIGRFGLDLDDEDPDAEIVQSLLDVSDGGNLATLQAAVTAAVASHSGFGTRIYDAIHVGQDELAGGVNPVKVLILISDGENVPVRGVTPPIHMAEADEATTAVANAAKAAGTQIVTISFGASGDGDDVGHRALLAGWATQPSADDQTGGDAVTQAEADAENADFDAFFISLDPDYAGLHDVFTMIANALSGMSICLQNSDPCTQHVCVPGLPGVAPTEPVCVEMYEDVAEVCVFTDDFNRVDNNSVGNTWAEDEFQIDDAAINGHRLLLMGGSEDDGDPDAAVTQLSIDATGLSGVTLSYLWRKLNNESEEADSLIVESRACGDVDFLPLATHSLGVPIPAWAYQSVDLPASCIDIRFRVDVSFPDEGALIENIKVCGQTECPGCEQDRQEP